MQIIKKSFFFLDDFNIRLNTIFYLSYGMEFSTLNESSLHRTLKIMYCETYEGKTEVQADGHVYDIVTKNGNVIEIQTRNLAKLLPKVQDAISKGRNVKIVHPNVIRTRIELYDMDGSMISRRLSPKKGCIYDVFRELTGIYPVLLNERFSLEIIQINMTERRVRTQEPEQSKNGRRRFKKNWQKEDKKLSEIIGTMRFNCAKDYIGLLPDSLPEEFCAKDLGNELRKNKDIPARISSNPHLIIWVLSHMGLLQEIEKQNRSRYYKINSAAVELSL